MSEKKANLFVVGAMKAGTTSFVDALSNHHSIYVSPIKEPHYFVEKMPKILYEPSRFFSIKSYFEKEFPSSLHIAHIKEEYQYNCLFSLQKEEKYALEASTMYLHAPNIAKKIHAYNPEAKIIIILRNPLERAFSQYNMLVGLSREVRSFETVMKEDIKAYNENRLPWYSCLGMSFYVKQIETFESFFKDVYVIKFEDYTTDKLRTVNNLLLTLDLIPFTEIKETKSNVTRTLRFKWGMYFLKKMGFKDFFSKLFTSRFKQKLFRSISSSKKTPINLTPETLDTLKEIFKKESS